MKNNCTIDEIMQFAVTSIECCGENETIKTIALLMRLCNLQQCSPRVLQELKQSH